MITYDLARKLEEAGFPKRGFLVQGYPIGFRNVVYNEDDTHCADRPSLDELMKECGNPFFKARYEDDRWYVQFPELEDEHGNVRDFWLRSLDEVFAYLYLELKEDE